MTDKAKADEDIPEPKVGLSRAEKSQVKGGARLRAVVVYEIIRTEGEGELGRTFSALWWSGLAAGISIGFSFLIEADARRAPARLRVEDDHRQDRLRRRLPHRHSGAPAALHREHADGRAARHQAAQDRLAHRHAAAVGHRARRQPRGLLHLCRRRIEHAHGLRRGDAGAACHRACRDAEHALADVRQGHRGRLDHRRAGVDAPLLGRLGVRPSSGS